MKLVSLWLLMFIPAVLIELFCFVTAPIVALFVTKELRTDRVKRLGNQVLTFDREYIIKPLRWWQTHDNAVDEYWWGLFTEDSAFRFVREAIQAEYDSSARLRYVCRLLWMWRNVAYGFHYALLSRPLDDEIKTRANGIKYQGLWYRLTVRRSSWQLEAHLPIPYTSRYNSVNIGWKEHHGFPRLMYANRVIGLRKYK